MDSDLPTALAPNTPATAGAPTVTLAAAAEVQRLDVAAMREKALGILASLKASSLSIIRVRGSQDLLYYVLYVLYYITYYIILCIVPPCVQRVRVRPGVLGGRKKERCDTCQYCIVVGNPLAGLPGAVQARGRWVRGRPFYTKAACSSSRVLLMRIPTCANHNTRRIRVPGKL